MVLRAQEGTQIHAEPAMGIPTVYCHDILSFKLRPDHHGELLVANADDYLRDTTP